MSPMPGRRPLLRSTQPTSIERAVRDHGRRIRKIERAPTRQVFSATPIPEQPIPPAPSLPESVTMLYTFDWLVGADQPESGSTPAVLRYVGGAWEIAEQPVDFFHVDGQSSRARWVSEVAGKNSLSTANSLQVSGANAEGWTEADNDDLMAYTFHCWDASGRLWKAEVPISGTDLKISRSDAGDGSDWALIATETAYSEIMGMAAHPTDPDMIAILASDNANDLPSIVITDDAATFTEFNLPVTDFSFYNFELGGFLGFLSTGRLVASYQYTDAADLFKHVSVAYSDDPTNSGSYTEVEVLSAYVNDDVGYYRIVGNITDDLLFIVTVREKLTNYRPKIRIGVSSDGGETWAEIDNDLEAPDAGVYTFDEHLGQPGGIKYFSDTDELWLFLYPYAEVGAENYQIIPDPVSLAWKATTPLTAPTWSDEEATINALTGHDKPAFAYDAVSHA